MSEEFSRYGLRGEPREIGRQHGARLAPAIGENLETYYRVFEYYAGLSRREVLARAPEFSEIIADFDADLMDEIRGIAEGARLSLEEIVALNARTEIMFKEGVREVPAECTSMAVTPEASALGNTLIGQNWDWVAPIQRNCVVLDIEQLDRPRVLTFTEAGFVGKIGMNSAGLGLCCNLLVTPDARRGVPFHLLCRQILNSTSIGDALGVLLSTPSGASGNFLIAHAEGEAVDVEKTPTSADYLYGPRGVLAHTNHFESRLNVDDQGRKLLPDSILRYCRAGKMLGRAAGQVELSTLQAIMRDHTNRPNSICRHIDRRAAEMAQLQTNASIIMNLSEATMYLCRGNPCEGRYQVERWEEAQTGAGATFH